MFHPPPLLRRGGEAVTQNSDRTGAATTGECSAAESTKYTASWCHSVFPKTIPLLNYQFERPAREDEKDPSWSINNVSDTTSDFSTWKIYDGDYIAIIENRHEEDYSIFITSKDTTTIATIDDVKAYWEKMQRQPDHDNVYEYSHLPYIRELNIIRTDDYECLGKPALFIEFAFASNWSKFWTETAVMFPHGKKIYTIKYRRNATSRICFTMSSSMSLRVSAS
ncbi:hypothetical protein H6770_00220 [Candidatus Peribacteria bacterium]|nr:hypothetical protein [Candidatus Peribacteria bacterium]